jgi:hypothetical protein
MRQMTKYYITKETTMSNITHAFTTDLEVAYVPFEQWLTAKHGAEKTAEYINGGKTEAFGAMYNEWLVDQKITHTIEEEGTETKVNTYKDLV